MAKLLAKCLYCGQTFDRNDKSIEWVKPKSNRYAHKKCHDEKDKFMSKEDKDKETFYSYCKQIFGDKFDFVKTKRLAESYVKKHNFTWSGMTKALVYFYEVKKNNFDYKNNLSSINYLSEVLTIENNNFDQNSINNFDSCLNDLGDANTGDKTGKKTTIRDKEQEIKEVKDIIIPEPVENDVEIEISKDKKEEENNGKKKLPQPPYQYLFEEINDKFFQKLSKDTYKLIRCSFKPTAHLRDLEKKMNDETYFADKKRNRDKEKIVNDPKQLGRKRREDISNRDHNRDSEDNIVKKIKAKVIETLLKFINRIINNSLDEDKIKFYVKILKNIKDDKEPEKEDLIKDLSYKETVNKTKKEKNLAFFKMPLKEFLSIEISPKFSTYEKNSNKTIINEIIKNEQDNDILMFILNDLTFEDFIDIYTHKKDLNSFGKLDRNRLNFIKTQFIYVDKLLKEVHEINNENNYFSRFISILYNLKRWFFIKQERNKKNKN